MDRQAVEQYGIIEELLMENAGQAVFQVLMNEAGVDRKTFVIFCGIGNNGGDGLVVARKIHSNGGKAIVFLLGDAAKFRGASKINHDIASRLGIPMETLQDLETARKSVAHADAIVDAILGTGLDRDVDGLFRDTIELINHSNKSVFSIDIPSGIHGNTGQIMGTAVKADYTITFGAPKLGNLLHPGFEMGGRLYLTHISFPPELHGSDHLKIETNEPQLLPARRQDTHKGDYGKVLFIAGSSQYLGAPYFSAMSFLKAGGGLSFLATPETIAPFIGSKGNEIILLPQKATNSGSISLSNSERLLAFSEKVDMVVLGPGLSLDEETQTLVCQLASKIRKPLLIDGDGISAIAYDLNCLKNRQSETILTPHLGEMARITNECLTEISVQRIAILRETAKKLKAIIVLKGAHSLIGLPDARIFMNLSGNPGMATAGSGDVLTGTIAAMHGLGLDIPEAVRTGVFMHGLAGDLAAQNKGLDGLIAGDILKQLPAALKIFREKFDTLVVDAFHKIHLL